MAKRTRDLCASGGRMNDEVALEDMDKDSDDEVERSIWAKTLLPTETS